MKRTMLALLGVFALGTILSHAGEVKVAFDGQGSGADLRSGPVDNTLLLPAAAPARWDVPPANGPECVDSPYGCPGSGSGSDNGSDNGGDDDGGNNNSGQGQQPAQPSANFSLEGPFIGAVCIYTNAGRSCYNETGRQAARRVTSYLYKKVIKDELMPDVVKFYFPPLKLPVIVKALLKLEKAVIKEVEAQVQEDIGRIQPFLNDTSPEAKEKCRQIIKNDEAALRLWQKAALKEAKSGKNWLNPYEFNENKESGWFFYGGDAYYTLGKALQGQAWYTRPW